MKPLRNAPHIWQITDVAQRCSELAGAACPQTVNIFYSRGRARVRAYVYERVQASQARRPIAIPRWEVLP